MHFFNHAENSKKENVKGISSCCLGEIIPLERLSNDTFSSLILGEGFGVIPEEDIFISPVDGVIKDISGNMQDFTIKTEDGLIIIISVGFSPDGSETPTECFVSVGDEIKSGGKLFSIDLNSFKERGKYVYAAVVVTNLEIRSYNVNYGRVKSLSQSVLTITV